MIEPEFLEVDVVLFLHDHALREFGGAQGAVKDDPLRDALARPRRQWASAGPGAVDRFDLAAAYAFGLVSDHAFADANKRTAWSTCALFLKVNGLGIAAPAADVIETVAGMAGRAIGEAGFAAWLRSHATPPSGAGR